MVHCTEGEMPSKAVARSALIVSHAQWPALRTHSLHSDRATRGILAEALATETEMTSLTPARTRPKLSDG